MLLYHNHITLVKKCKYYIKGYSEFTRVNSEDTKILKEEMRGHLYEEVEELKKQGLSE